MGLAAAIVGFTAAAAFCVISGEGVRVVLAGSVNSRA